MSLSLTTLLLHNVTTVLWCAFGIHVAIKLVPLGLPVKIFTCADYSPHRQQHLATYDSVLRWLPMVCQGNFSASVRNSRATNTSCVLLAAGVLSI